jgi:hypothetical protein
MLLGDEDEYDDEHDTEKVSLTSSSCSSSSSKMVFTGCCNFSNVEGVIYFCHLFSGQHTI